MKKLNKISDKIYRIFKKYRKEFKKLDPSDKYVWISYETGEVIIYAKNITLLKDSVQNLPENIGDYGYEFK